MRAGRANGSRHTLLTTFALSTGGTRRTRFTLRAGDTLLTFSTVQPVLTRFALRALRAGRANGSRHTLLTTRARFTHTTGNADFLHNLTENRFHRFHVYGTITPIFTRFTLRAGDTLLTTFATLTTRARFTLFALSAGGTRRTRFTLRAGDTLLTFSAVQPVLTRFTLRALRAGRASGSRHTLLTAFATRASGSRCSGYSVYTEFLHDFTDPFI